MNKYKIKRNIVLSVFTLFCILTVIVLLLNPNSVISDILVAACFIMSFTAYLLIRKARKASSYNIRKTKKSEKYISKIAVNENDIDMGKVIPFPDSVKRQRMRNAKEK